MSMTEQFEKYLKTFMAEHIRGLPKSFGSVKEYRDQCMLMFNGWRILQRYSDYHTPRFKRLDLLMKKIDDFDTTLGRPIDLQTVRSITNHTTWLEIHQEARMFPDP